MRLARALLALLALVLVAPGARAQPSGERLGDVLGRLDSLRAQIGSRSGGVIALMGYNMSPDGSTNALQINRTVVGTNDEGDPTLTLSQYGFGFTWSDSFPLYTEAFLGTARYDPRALFTNLPPNNTPLRWNNIGLTGGIGYDFRIGEYLFLRPIFNLSAGYAASDASLFGQFINYRTDRDIDPLTDRHANIWGIGGSLMLAYYDYQPPRDIDVELRYTQLYLQTFGDTLPAARGTSMAQTASLWVRYRWPTGWEAFGRPVRWVSDNNISVYLGDQEKVIGFAWAVKIGGGIEIDIGRYEVGAVGLDVSRLRLVARYFFGDNNITGVSVGIGMSF